MELSSKSIELLTRRRELLRDFVGSPRIKGKLKAP